MSGARERCAPARDHVERYLRRLSRWTPRQSRHDLLAEASRHLYEATRRGEEAGLTREMAQRMAVRAFGPAWRIGLSERGVFDHPLFAALTGAANALRAPCRRLRPRRLLRRRRLGRKPRPF